jgi:glucokinase
MQPESPIAPERGDVVIAADVGGTHVTAGTVGLSAPFVASVTQRRRLPLSAGASAADILGTVAAALGAVPDDALVALAVPGPFDYESGVARYTGVGKFEALNGVDVGVELAARLGIARARIRFCNDADACGLGEAATGAGAGLDRVLCLTLGTGVGSAYIEHGRALRSDRRVPRDGDAYHLTVAEKPLEDLISRRAIRAAYRRPTGADLDVREIMALARNGDATAATVLHEATHALGLALAPWLRSFEPEVIVVGGSIAQSWDVLEPLLDRAFAGRRLRAATLGEDAPLIGAAADARRERSGAR